MGNKRNKRAVKNVGNVRRILLLYSQSYATWAGNENEQVSRGKTKIIDGFTASKIIVRKVSVTSGGDLTTKLTSFKTTRERDQFDVVALAPNHCSQNQPSMFLDTNIAIGLKSVLEKCQQVAPEVHICSCFAGSYLEDLVPTNNKLRLITGYSAEIGGLNSIQEYQLEHIHGGCGKSNIHLRETRNSENKFKTLVLEPN
jgi:hypothetical protein